MHFYGTVGFFGVEQGKKEFGEVSGLLNKLNAELSPRRAGDV